MKTEIILCIVMILILITPEYKKLMPKKLTLIMGISGLMLTAVFGIIIHSSKMYEFHALNGRPICSNDGVRFSSESCVSCKAEIEQTGYFRNSETLNTEKFTTQFSNYKAYKKSLQINKILTVIFSIVSIFSLYNFYIRVLQRFSGSSMKKRNKSVVIKQKI